MFHREPTEKGAAGVALAGLAVLLVALVSASCGGSSSKADQAKSDVCSARADISSNLNHLRSMSAGTVTLDAVRSDVQAIQADLDKIKHATPELASDTKQQVQQATSTFTAQLQTTVGNLLTSVSLSDAKTQVKQAATELQKSYASTLGGLSCS
jgi:chaperonin cofactor prefoldin